MNSAAKTKKKVKNRLKSNIIKGTLILSCASILSRIIGFIYRIYLADILGEQLLGTYQLIFHISLFFLYMCCALRFTERVCKVPYLRLLRHSWA